MGGNGNKQTHFAIYVSDIAHEIVILPIQKFSWIFDTAQEGSIAKL